MATAYNEISQQIKISIYVLGDIAALHRGTPLYGQPSWWGDGDADDENSFKQESKKQESGVPGEGPRLPGLGRESMLLFGCWIPGCSLVAPASPRPVAEHPCRLFPLC